MQQDRDKIERILVRGTNWIGDAIMSAPAMRRLRSSFPEANITLLASARTTAVFEDSPLCDEVIQYRRRAEGLRTFIETVKTIRARRFDLAVLFQNAFEAALLSYLGGARLRIGYAEQGRGFLLTHRLHHGPEHRNRHQVHDYLDIVAECERICLGSDLKANDSSVPSLIASSRQKDAAMALLECFGIETGSRSLVAINAGATNSRAKCWPAERFATLADRLAKEMDAQIVLIGAPSELEYADNVISSMETNGVADLTGKTSLVELIGLLDRCDLVITNDTGPAHIAAALGRPTITIFGPTNEFETAPPASEILRAEGIDCARCMLRDCPIDHRCMTRISADSVFDCARKILD
jgi:lipopolysaccharide heptosyltransferase II